MAEALIDPDPEPSLPLHRLPQDPPFSGWGQVPGPLLGPFSEKSKII